MGGRPAAARTGSRGPLVGCGLLRLARWAAGGTVTVADSRAGLRSVAGPWGGQIVGSSTTSGGSPGWRDGLRAGTSSSTGTFGGGTRRHAGINDGDEVGGGHVAAVWPDRNSRVDGRGRQRFGRRTHVRVHS